MYSLDGALLGGVALGEPAGVVTGVANLYITGAGLVLGVVLAIGFALGVLTYGRLIAGFRSVTGEYGCKLRKGLVLLGLVSLGL